MPVPDEFIEHLVGQVFVEVRAGDGPGWSVRIVVERGPAWGPAVTLVMFPVGAGNGAVGEFEVEFVGGGHGLFPPMLINLTQPMDEVLADVPAGQEQGNRAGGEDAQPDDRHWPKANCEQGLHGAASRLRTWRTRSRLTLYIRAMLMFDSDQSTLSGLKVWLRMRL